MYGNGNNGNNAKRKREANIHNLVSDITSSVNTNKK